MILLVELEVGIAFFTLALSSAVNIDCLAIVAGVSCSLLDQAHASMLA